MIDCKYAKYEPVLGGYICRLMGGKATPAQCVRCKWRKSE